MDPLAVGGDPLAVGGRWLIGHNLIFLNTIIPKCTAVTLHFEKQQIWYPFKGFQGQSKLGDSPVD